MIYNGYVIFVKELNTQPINMKTRMIIAAFALLTTACQKDGCTDEKAYNYNSEAKNNDGSCEYVLGCTDPTATNYNDEAAVDDGQCEYSGRIIFWTDQPDVMVNARHEETNQQAITYLSLQQEPEDCKDTRGASIELSVGAHPFMIQVVSDTLIKSYILTIDVYAGDCSKVYVK